jgi:hypothetical protein
MRIIKKQLKIIMLPVAILTLTACGGEFSYKRGATVADFKQSKSSCEESASSQTEIDACLAADGWLVVDIDKPLSPVPMPVDPDDPESIAEQADVAVAAPDPLDEVKVGAWFKLGASSNQLMADRDKCVAELGEAHQSKHNMTLVTRGLISCMSELRWHVLEQ